MADKDMFSSHLLPFMYPPKVMASVCLFNINRQCLIIITV